MAAVDRPQENLDSSTLPGDGHQVLAPTNQQPGSSDDLVRLLRGPPFFALRTRCEKEGKHGIQRTNTFEFLKKNKERRNRGRQQRAAEQGKKGKDAQVILPHTSVKGKKCIEVF